MHNFTVANVGCSYMFRLLKSSYHQAVCQKVWKGERYVVYSTYRNNTSLIL